MPRLRVGGGGVRAESIDLRVVALFLVLTAALLAPAAWHLTTPTDPQELDDFLSSLRSRANEAAAIIERRDRVTRAYFSSELEELGDATDQERGVLLHRPADAAAASLLPSANALADTFSGIVERAALSYDNLTALQGERGRLDALRAELDRIAGG
jgi:hypothetical protein